MSQTYVIHFRFTGNGFLLKILLRDMNLGIVNFKRYILQLCENKFASVGPSTSTLPCQSNRSKNIHLPVTGGLKTFYDIADYKYQSCIRISFVFEAYSNGAE